MVAGVLAWGDLMETLRGILCGRAPLLDRHLEDSPSVAVGNLELQAAEAGRLHRQLAICPERLLKDRPKVRQVDALVVLVQVVLVTDVEEVERHLMRVWCERWSGSPLACSRDVRPFQVAQTL